MPLTLPSFNFAIICDGNELETYNVTHEGPDSATVFVASEAGKQFRIALTNNLSDFDISATLYIDGKTISSTYFQAEQRGEIRGIRISDTMILPFKFQELELVDPDLEHAPILPEMGTIEVRIFRCLAPQFGQYIPSRNASGLHQGSVSERSKKAGWHHISTADAVPSHRTNSVIDFDRIDPIDAPYASVKVFYRPRELLKAQGVIIERDVGAGIRGESASVANDRKRAGEDGSSGPSKRRASRTRSTIKNENIAGFAANARAQRIQALQGELNSLMDEQTGSSVKHELRSSSPIVVGQAGREVIDLTLED